MPIWQEILLVVGFWTVSIGLLWLPLYFLFMRLDRKLKDGPRCRKCGYDLRATEGDQCPECGSMFKPRGVWPPGKPSRKPVIHLIMLWSWFIVAATLALMVSASAYHYDVLQKKTLSVTAFQLADPNSGQYPYALIALSGSQWQWFPDKDRIEVAPTQATIWLYDDNTTLAACTFDIRNLELDKPVYENDQATAIKVNGELIDKNAASIADALIRGLERNQGPVQREELLRDEVALLTALAVTASEQPLISNIEPIPIGLIQDGVEKTGAYDQFGSVKNSDWSDGYIDFLPDWTYGVVPVSGLLIWLAGIIAIRKYVYRRMAVDEVPVFQHDIEARN